MATTPKIIQVSWIDAVADVGWEAKTKAEIHHCITVGYVVDETDEALCLASTWSIDQTNARMHIPKAWIKNRKVLASENTISESKGKKPTKVGRQRATKKISATKRT
jgi:uncharacterized protein YqfA (UPF0365 family)